MSQRMEQPRDPLSCNAGEMLLFNGIPVNECDIGPFDVLCGRNRAAFNNVGNRRFRIVVSLSLARYVDVTSTRKEKSKLIENVIQSTKECGGRFLQVGRNGLLVELSQKRTYDKVGHALRDMAASKDVGDNSWMGFSSSDLNDQHNKISSMRKKRHIKDVEYELPNLETEQRNKFNIQADGEMVNADLTACTETSAIIDKNNSTEIMEFYSSSLEGKSSSPYIYETLSVDSGAQLCGLYTKGTDQHDPKIMSSIRSSINLINYDADDISLSMGTSEFVTESKDFDASDLQFHPSMFASEFEAFNISSSLRLK